MVAYEWMMLGLKLRIDAEAVLTVLTSRWCIPTFDNINRCSVYCLINQYLCFFIKLLPLSSLINSFWKSLVKFLLLQETMVYNVYFTHDDYQPTLFIKNLLCMYSCNMMSGGWEISCVAGSCKNCSFPLVFSLHSFLPCLSAEMVSPVDLYSLAMENSYWEYGEKE